jgi:hypothetical protein
MHAYLHQAESRMRRGTATLCANESGRDECRTTSNAIEHCGMVQWYMGSNACMQPRSLTHTLKALLLQPLSHSRLSHKCAVAGC